MDHPSSTELPATPELVFDMLQAHQRTAALRAAIELDVFRAVGQGPGDVASIAQHCSASERGIRILCDFLAIHGVLTKTGGHYRHSPCSAAFLDPNSPTCIASIARFLANPELRKPFDDLTEVVRRGRTVLPGQGTVEEENPIWVQFAETMGPMMAPMVRPLGELVLNGHRGPMRVLDIAAGHGLFGIEIARQNPQARITGLDWAPVLKVAIKNAERAGVQDRYEMLPGSAFEVDFGEPYDVVLLTNFLHHFDHPTCVDLLKKVHRSLRPGGKVAALEFVPNEDRITPAVPAAFSLMMLASTPAGDAYTLSDLTRMYEEAGFDEITAHPVEKSPHTIVMGTAGRIAESAKTPAPATTLELSQSA